jgi:hypothetical protein
VCRCSRVCVRRRGGQWRWPCRRDDKCALGGLWGGRSSPSRRERAKIIDQSVYVFLCKGEPF